MRLSLSVVSGAAWRRGVLTASAALMFASACSSSGSGPETQSPEGPVSVVASFYPVAFAAERIGLDDAVVENLTPPGVEPHDLELDATKVEAISKADLILYLGQGFQPAVEQAIANDATGERIDLLEGVALMEGDGEEGLTVDPHIWLSPVLMQDMVARAERGLAATMPANAQAFHQRSEGLQHELAALDEEFRTGLADCDSRSMVTAHSAFGYLTDAYGLEQHPIAGLSPDAEPDPARLAELTDLVKKEGVTTIFTETLVSPRVADTLAAEAGVGTAVLNPLEGLSGDESAAGEDYFSVMRSNLAVLREALGCR